MKRARRWAMLGVAAALVLAAPAQAPAELETLSVPDVELDGDRPRNGGTITPVVDRERFHHQSPALVYEVRANVGERETGVCFCAHEPRELYPWSAERAADRRAPGERAGPPGILVHPPDEGGDREALDTRFERDLGVPHLVPARTGSRKRDGRPIVRPGSRCDERVVPASNG